MHLFCKEAVDELQERRIRADERGGGKLPGMSASRLLHAHEIVLKTSGEGSTRG